MRKWIWICVLAVLAAQGCTKPAETEGGKQAESALKPASEDEKIAEAVKAKLAADPELKSEQISVDVKDGRVTLAGTVSNDSVRAKADLAVREVPDVFGVDADKLITK